MASTREPAFVAPSAIIPLEKRPLKETFTLPDLTPVQFDEDEQTHHIKISLGLSPEEKQDNSHARFPRSKEELEATLQPIIEFIPLGRKAKASHLQVKEDRATLTEVLEIKASAGHVSFKDLWSALYAFWIRRDEHERYPILIGSSFPNRIDIVRYFLHCGLGLRYPDAQSEFDIVLDRSAFWQGAGSPLSRSWLRAPEPSPKEFGDVMGTAFPLIQSFTRSNDPPVLTTHPLRPPKPVAGTIIYSRYVHSIKSHYQLTIIDWRKEEHFNLYAKWQNSDRVNHGWRERGDEEHHRKYLQEREADPHSMGLLSSWDGEYAGYSEVNWCKENGMNAFVGGMGDYDQGTHSFVGEEKFRGRYRFAHNMISLKHFCFLREFRTDKVVGEPRYDLAIIPLLAAYLPQSFRKEIELPHKRSVLFILHRDRFFSEGMFY